MSSSTSCWSANPGATRPRHCAGRRDRRLEAHICASSLTDIDYISRKLAGAEKARIIVRRCLDRLQVVNVTLICSTPPNDGAAATSKTIFEPSCAVDARLDAIVTRDPEGFTGSPVPVLTPDELLVQLSKATDA